MFAIKMKMHVPCWGGRRKAYLVAPDLSRALEGEMINGLETFMEKEEEELVSIIFRTVSR